MKIAVHSCMAMLAVMAGAVNASEPIRIAPSSKWIVSYDEEACRLRRVFGTGEQKVAFLLERFAPGRKFTLVVAGAPLKGAADERAWFRFGDAKPQIMRFVLIGKLPAFQPAIIVPAMYLDAEKSEKRGDRANLSEPAMTLLALGAEEREVAKGISWLSIRPAGRDPLILELGNLEQPIRALQQCTSDIISQWGVDAARHQTLRRAAAPANRPSEWMSDRDYPKRLLRAGMEGLVHFRLMLDEKGAATSCHIQASTRPREFDELVCSDVMRRAKFKPALDASGSPLPSYFRSTAKFEIPN